MKLIISDKAQWDYEESFKWYLARSVDAALEFSVTIEEGMQKVVDNPFVWRSAEEGFREIILEDYPFTIVYTILEEFDEILITSIYHHKRNPANKYNK